MSGAVWKLADHVVTTFAQTRDEEPIMHAYGPYTLIRARLVRKQFLETTHPADCVVHIRVCKIVGLIGDHQS